MGMARKVEEGLRCVETAVLLRFRCGGSARMHWGSEVRLQLVHCGVAGLAMRAEVKNSGDEPWLG